MFKAGSHRLPVLSFLRLYQNEHKAGKQGKNCGTEKCLIDFIKPSQGKNVFTFLPMETRRMVRDNIITNLPSFVPLLLQSRVIHWVPLTGTSPQSPSMELLVLFM